MLVPALLPPAEAKLARSATLTCVHMPRAPAGCNKAQPTPTQLTGIRTPVQPPGIWRQGLLPAQEYLGTKPLRLW